MGTANFGIVGLDWQQRVNWDRLKKYRTERAREHMKKHGLGAMLCMYDENVRYLTGFTGSNGWVLLWASGAVLLTDPRYEIQASEQTDCAVRVAMLRSVPSPPMTTTRST